MAAFASLTAIAQTPTGGYEWDSIPIPHQLSVSESDDHAVGTKDVRILEYTYDDQQKSDLVMYYTKHLIVKVNTQEGIEQFNRIYVPVGGVSEVVTLKARSVSKNGKVVTLSESDIKISEGESEAKRYRYFAMEGLEPGSEVEYLFQLKYDANLFGSERLQDDYLKKNVSFDLYVPGNFIFSTRSYNGLPEMIRDSAYAGGEHFHLSAPFIPPLEAERYAAYEANLQRVEYTVRFNTAVSEERVLDWNAAASALYQQYFSIEKNEKKAVSRVLKQLTLAGDLKNRIIQLDNYLKTHIAIQQSYDDQLENLEFILKNNVANTRGITRLYVQLLTEMNAEPEAVVTTSRYTTRFDATFETWNYLEEVLLFIPSCNLYLAPDNFIARGGLAPQDMEDNDGLFIRPILSGNKNEVKAEVKRIEASHWSVNRHDIYATVHLDPPFDAAKVHLKQEITGHAAEFIQPYYQFMNESDREKLLQPLVNIAGEDGKISNLTFRNELENNIPDRPFVIESDLLVASLMEKAGSRILFKIGNLIGEQVEMYSEDDRQNDVENEFNRGYHREIMFEIPHGYRVKNLDALTLKVEATDGDQVPYYFHSSYSVENDTVKVIIQEVYSQIRYPAAKFEEFRKVVNAAADWNKVVLILEKVN